MVTKIYNFLSQSECEEYLQNAPHLSIYSFSKVRAKHFRDEDLLNRVKSALNIDYKLYQNFYQTWGVKSQTELHNHENPDTLTSIIYLNDDFDGGEFFTETETIKPEPGLLIFFDSKNVWHGVKEIKRNVRKTILTYWMAS